MEITNEDLLDWSSLLGGAGSMISGGGNSYMGDDAFTEEQKRQMLVNAASMSEPAQPVEVAQPTTESPVYEAPSGLMDLKDVPDEVQTASPIGESGQYQGMEPWRRNLLSLGAMLSRAGSALMPDRANGKQLGNTMANYFEGQLYGDARKKALAAALANSGGGSLPFGNSPMEAMMDLDTRGLNAGQIKEIFDSGYAEMTKERQFPIDLAKNLTAMGLTEAQIAETIQQLGLRPRAQALHERATEQDIELKQATIAEKQRATQQKQKADERWLDTKAKIAAGTIELPDAVKSIWPFIEGLEPGEAVKVVNKAITANRERPITTPNAMLIDEALANNGKVSPETMKLYEMMMKAGKKEKDLTTTGHIMADTNRRMVNRGIELYQTYAGKDEKDMSELMAVLKPDAYGQINFAPLYKRLVEKGGQQAVDKLRRIEEMYRAATNNGDAPGVAEREIDEKIFGRKPSAPAQPVPGKVSAYDPIINKVAPTVGLAPDLVKSVIFAESKGNPNAVSPKGAMGLMQLMPNTAKMYGVVGKDLFDPEKNITVGVTHLGKMKKMFGSTPRALIAYNWGDERVRKDPDLKKIPSETVNYVNKVLGGQIGKGKDGKLKFKYADGRIEDV